MTNKIPNPVIGAVSSVLAEYYYSHSVILNIGTAMQIAFLR